VDHITPITAGVGLVVATVVLAIGQVPELGFALSIMGVGSLVGTLRAAAKKKRDPDVEALPIQAFWMAAGFAGGWVVVALDALL
jgi:hypothetical protein